MSKRIDNPDFIPILYYVLLGLDIKMIGQAMKLKKKTVNYRLSCLFKMYGVKNRFQLMAKFVQMPIHLRPKQITIKKFRQMSSSNDVLVKDTFNA